MLFYFSKRVIDLMRHQSFTMHEVIRSIKRIFIVIIRFEFDYFLICV